MLARMFSREWSGQTRLDSRVRALAGTCASQLQEVDMSIPACGYSCSQRACFLECWNRLVVAAQGRPVGCTFALSWV